MFNQVTKNIVLPKSAIREKEGVVILPLERWRAIEGDLEDLEMYCSGNLAKEIAKRRKEKGTIPLEKILFDVENHKITILKAGNRKDIYQDC